MKSNKAKAIDARPRARVADPARRRVLARLGAFAVYTAPVMTTLLASTEARATHKPGHVVGPLDVCSGPNRPPACDRLPPGPCEGPGNNPLCDVAGEVGSLGGSPETASFGDSFAGDAPDIEYDAPADDGDWDQDY